MPSRARTALLVVHALPPAENTGAPLAAHGYARTLGNAGWRVTVVSASPTAPPWPHARRCDDPSESFFRLAVPPDVGMGSSWLEAWAVPRTATGDPRVDTGPHVARMLDRLRPDLVHIIDNVSLPLCIPEVAHEKGIPVIRSVSCAEDLCALVVPISPCSGHAGYCEPPLTVEHCGRCVSEVTPDHVLGRFGGACGASVGTPRHAELRAMLAAQRARAAHQFHSVYDRVLFASEQFRSYFEQTLPLDPLRTRVVPMGVDIAGPAPIPPIPPIPPSPRPGAGPRTFLVAGNTHAAKGTHAIVAAFTHPELASRDDWRLLLAGGGDRGMYGPLLTDPRVEDRGPYLPDELAALCDAAAVGISASVFETFHRVTREYLARGLPVVGSMAFGISDVVVDERNGLLFDHADSGGLRRAIVRLLDDRTLLAQLATGARASTIRSVADEVATLESIYEEVIRTRARRRWQAAATGATSPFGVQAGFPGERPQAS